MNEIDGRAGEQDLGVLGGEKASGLGAMMAGGNPASGERQKDDFYPTPPEVTRALLAVESFTGAIWEPACGDGAMARELLTSGQKIVATDLSPRGFGAKLDFLKVPPRKVANIVTNPPFDLAEAFIRQGMAMQPDKMCLVLKATYWHAVTRQALFREFKPARIYPLTWRPDFMALGRPTMEVQWCVWERGFVGEPSYIPLLKAECDRATPRATRKKLAIS
jgi:hypothetical protein